MIRKNPDGKFPSINKASFIDSTAIIIGNVKIGRNVFVGPGAVIRADEPGSFIIVKDNCNIQDRVIIHGLKDSSVIMAESVSLAHGCIVHGPCKIGKNCFIGFGAIVFDAELADNVIVKHLAVVEGVRVSSKRLVPSGAVIDMQVKVKTLKLASRKLRYFALEIIKTNMDLAKCYKK